LATTAVSDPHSPTVGHHHTSTGLDNRKIAIWAFIGSECMLFATLISTYMIYKGRSIIGPMPHETWTDPSTGHVYPAILDIPVTSASTFVLLMSSFAMVLALSAVQDRRKPKNNRRERILGNPSIWLAMTAALGLVFLAFQAYEFTAFVHEGLTISRNLFGSTFFTLTGFHGAHVAAGVIWLSILLGIDMRRGLMPEDALNVDLCALYWHFVDVVWIAIFTLVYLIR
jgi:cytochrome c oxidase subunit III